VIPCLTIGDSLAVGVGEYLPQCRTEATVGINSDRFIQTFRGPAAAGQVVISLGVNDSSDIPTADNLLTLRRSVHAARVFWLLPAGHEPVRRTIRGVAARFGDRLIDTAPFAGPDGLHPTRTGYRELAALTTRPPADAIDGSPPPVHSSLPPATTVASYPHGTLSTPPATHTAGPTKLPPGFLPVPPRRFWFPNRPLALPTEATRQTNQP
jgi:hypothetical protein